MKGSGIKSAAGLVLAAVFFLPAAVLCAQQPQSGQPGDGQQPVPSKTQTDLNPFPDDTSAVPVMPSRSAADLPAEVEDNAADSGIPMPAADSDPVRSPEEAAESAESSQSGFSSSRAGTDNVFPSADDDTQPVKRDRKGRVVEAEHQETAAEDENVGRYYLDKKNWKAALSRFQSALVLDPDNPDVYWGLAESQRHLGDLANARANYVKVTEYDPDSKHGKDAFKLLKDPSIANAKASAPAQTAVPAQE